MDIAAFASFLALVIAWLVLPLRAPAVMDRDELTAESDLPTAVPAAA